MVDLVGDESGGASFEHGDPPLALEVLVVQQMLGHASAAMTLDVYAGLFNADLDDVADRLVEVASLAAGVPWVCPEDGPEGGDETVGEGGDDGDDGVGGVPALVS